MKDVIVKGLLALLVILLTVGAYLGLCAILPHLTAFAYGLIGLGFGLAADIVLFKYVFSE